MDRNLLAVSSHEMIALSITRATVQALHVYERTWIDSCCYSAAGMKGAMILLRCLADRPQRDSNLMKGVK